MFAARCERSPVFAGAHSLRGQKPKLFPLAIAELPMFVVAPAIDVSASPSTGVGVAGNDL
jgi:hypothetical protein